MTVLKLISNKGFISYNKVIAKRLGVNEAILLGELCSIFDYFHYNEFYINQERISNDTALSIKQIRTSMSTLVEAGVVTVTKKGQPCKNWYYINEDAITAILESAEDEEVPEENYGYEEQPFVQFAQKVELDVPKGNNKMCQKVTSSSDKREALLINNNTNKNTDNNNTNSNGSAIKKKTKADYELFLNSLEAKDNETYRKSAVLFADFKKSITPKFTASNATLLKWQYDFALYSQKHSINPEELYNALSYAIYDSFWKTCLFSPKNLFNFYEKIRQKMYFSKNQSNNSHRKFDGTVMPDFVNDYLGVANVERK